MSLEFYVGESDIMNIQDHYRLLVDRCVDRECMDGLVYGWMDAAWMDQCVHSWTNGWMDKIIRTELMPEFH